MKDAAASQPALSQQLADVILLLAERDRLPSRNTVMAFTDELTGALIGKDFNGNARPRWLLGPIVEILSSSGANFTKASRLGDTLKSLGVDTTRTQRITSKFIRIVRRRSVVGCRYAMMMGRAKGNSSHPQAALSLGLYGVGCGTGRRLYFNGFKTTIGMTCRSSVPELLHR